MYSILKEAGVKAYTLKLAGEGMEDILTDFPNRHFNHAILCIPNGKDTTWLECTSQDAVAGFMGTWTGNRHALLITEEGGKLVPTKTYTISDNQQLRKLNAKLNPDASLSFQSITDYYGTQQETYHGVINTLLSKEKVNRFLQNKLTLPHLTF
jgi:hypothetical protein